MAKGEPYASLIVSAICAPIVGATLYFNVRLAQLNLANGGIRLMTLVGLIVTAVNLVICLTMFHSSLEKVRRLRRRTAGRCAECGYDLRESTGQCPECGKSIE